MGVRVLTASTDSTARFREAESGKLLATFQGHTGGVYSEIFSPDGRRVLTASGSLGELLIDLWCVDHGQNISRLDLGSNIKIPGFQISSGLCEDRRIRMGRCQAGQLKQYNPRPFFRMYDSHHQARRFVSA